METKERRPDAPEGEPQGPEDERRGTSFLEVAQSVGAGLLGVQSSKNRTRDFQRGKPLHFIVGGLIGTILFLVVVWLFVRVMIATG